jgi:hypothetical protein
LANGTIWIKNLENKEERVVSIDSLWVVILCQFGI